MTEEGNRPMRVGMLGAGMIATVGYGILPNLHHIADKAEVVAIADPVLERAQQAAKDFNIPAAYATLDELLDKAELDAVVNVTPITYHGETSLKIVQAGKHLATEKPLAATMDEADAIIETAAANGVTIVSSPPDMIDPVYQEAQRLLAEGMVGKVAFARVRSSHGGPGGSIHGWPMDPSWFYQQGSGPLLDMGVYGIHEITGLLGPAKRVVAFSGITEPTRHVRGPGPFSGLEMEVTADDNNLFMLDFGQSTFAVVDGSFNVLASKSPKLEIFGRKGVLNVLPHGSSDPLEVFRTDVMPGVDGWAAPGGWSHLRARQAWWSNLGRGILVDHLVDCVASNVKPVLSAEHARHALEIMIKVSESSRSGQALDLTTSF